MGFYYENLIRPVLFKADPEKAHDFGVTALDYLGKLSFVCRFMEKANLVHAGKPIELFGLQFPNSIGLAAGLSPPVPWQP